MGADTLPAFRKDGAASRTKSQFFSFVFVTGALAGDLFSGAVTRAAPDRRVAEVTQTAQRRNGGNRATAVLVCKRWWHLLGAWRFCRKLGAPPVGIPDNVQASGGEETLGVCCPWGSPALQPRTPSSSSAVLKEAASTRFPEQALGAVSQAAQLACPG